MNFSMQCCLRSLKQNRRKVHILTYMYSKKYTKLWATSFSQLATETNLHNYKSTGMERAELVLLRNILSIHHLPREHNNKIPSTVSQINYQVQQMVTNQQNDSINSQTIGEFTSTELNRQLLFWEDIVLKPRKLTKVKQYNQELQPIKPKILYCTTVHNYHKKTQKDYNIRVKDHCLQFNKETKNEDFNKEKRGRRPSAEQLSLVLLRLREELPHFFEGHHRYSIYREDILFVNKLTKTTTRSLKAYKFLMNSMQYIGRLCWSNASLEIIRITKHLEDNTIKIRWTAKGIPWYIIPFYILTGKPQTSLIYRYVDGFSILEVGRDGLVHCHRLDKVIPTSTPERQRWSLRGQILALLGLTEMERGACEAFQNEDILKKA